jgi:hypothetical protein
MTSWFLTIASRSRHGVLNDCLVVDVITIFVLGGGLPANLIASVPSFLKWLSDNRRVLWS